MTSCAKARRDTPLGLVLKERIRRSGPISLADYMHACLHDPEHGYYRSRAAIGANGDFVTAPEISQVFGELIGLWCAVVWQQLGAPAKFNLVELGPGRGTLMADALRATKIVPGFHAAADIVLIESNAALRAEQARALAAHDRIAWAADLEALVGKGPSIIIGNEFLDTFDAYQFEFCGGEWRAREIGLDAEGELQFVTARDAADCSELIPATLQPKAGDIYEVSPSLRRIARSDLAKAAALRPMAALFIDYGHAQTAFGDTLQAVRNHAYEHPLTSPGEADLTAHVDFQQFGDAAREAGLSVDGPVPQATFLAALGIMQRASKLMTANPAQAHVVETGVARLMAVPGMGDRFKAIGLRSPGLPPLPGF